MKIVYLAAGAGGMYCGSCLHDNTLARALVRLGEDVLLVPTYTPLRTDEPDVSQRRMFFGGINVYLQQKSTVFRHTPWLIDSLLDSPRLIKMAARLGGSVDPAKLGDLTVSMLLGEHGRQKKELQKLVSWLSDERPDVVHLSNSMLLGMAREIRRLGLPVICSLSGEDIFLEKLTEPHYSQARAALRQRARDADAFVSLNHYYADYMAEYLHVPPEQIRVIPHGVDLEGHGSRGPRADGRAVVGYLARICPDKGLHHLVAAMELLMAEDGLPPVRLRVAGYLSPTDRPYLDGIVARASSWPSRFELEHVGEVSRAGKIEFLQSLDVMSVPTVYRESKGLSILEALANAVPVVQPAHGTFPEIIEDTGGGLLFEPDNPTSLAQQIKRLIIDRELAQQLGRAGQQAVRERYHAGAMAERTRDLYHELSRATLEKRPARIVSGIS